MFEAQDIEILLEIQKQFMESPNEDDNFRNTANIFDNLFLTSGNQCLENSSFYELFEQWVMKTPEVVECRIELPHKLAKKNQNNYQYFKYLFPSIDEARDLVSCVQEAPDRDLSSMLHLTPHMYRLKQFKETRTVLDLMKS